MLNRRVRLAALNCLLEGNPVGHPAHGVLSLELLELSWSVLVQELIQGQEAATDANLNLVLDALDHDTFGAELIDTFGLTHEHNLELLTVRVIVYVLGKLLVNRIVFDGDVNRYARLQVNDVLT